MCNGYWEKCNCNDCAKAKDLYERIEWLESDREANLEEIKELENEIEAMGYFV